MKNGSVFRSLIHWKEFAELRPEMAEAGQKLLWLEKPEKGGLAYLATVGRDGRPRVHPISPTIVEGHLYAFVLKRSPKKADLLLAGHYALHSFPHRSLYTEDHFNDEEFYMRGQAKHVTDMQVRERVAKACGDPVETGEVFELGMDRALHKHREKGKAVYRKWSA